MPAFIVASGSVGHADSGEIDPDFYLLFEKCRSTVAVRYPVAKGTAPVRTMDYEGHTTACERTKKHGLSCVTVFQDGSKPVAYEATITDETMVSITFETGNGGDFVDMNPETHAVVSLTRMWREKFVGSKVCHGSYLTADEARMLKERDRKAKAKKR